MYQVCTGAIYNVSIRQCNWPSRVTVQNASLLIVLIVAQNGKLITRFCQCCSSCYTTLPPLLFSSSSVFSSPSTISTLATLQAEQLYITYTPALHKSFLTLVRIIHTLYTIHCKTITNGYCSGEASKAGGIGRLVIWTWWNIGKTGTDLNLQSHLQRDRQEPRDGPSTIEKRTMSRYIRMSEWMRKWPYNSTLVKQERHQKLLPETRNKPHQQKS